MAARADDLELLGELADIADAWLAEHGGQLVVDRDPAQVHADEQVFIFQRVPAQLDDQVLVVTRSTEVAHLVPYPPWELDPFPHARPLRSE